MTTKRAMNHPFDIRLLEADGSYERLTHIVPVRRGTHKIVLTLTEQDVLDSIALGGAGNSRMCAGALCIMRHNLPFPVFDVDFTLSKAYLAYKRDRNTRIPTRCYAFNHYSSVPHLFDTARGQKELLEYIRSRKTKSITLILHPIRKRAHYDTSKYPKDHRRSPTSTRPPSRGARRRFANARLGFTEDKD